MAIDRIDRRGDPCDRPVLLFLLIALICPPGRRGRGRNGRRSRGRWNAHSETRTGVAGRNTA
jgi:hypothetical protein